jgi:hypothetical protein
MAQVPKLLLLGKSYRSLGWALCGIGMIMAFVALAFSYKYRSHILLKLGSVRLNNITVVG